MSNNPLRLLILGAHPDDAEYHAGGLAAIYRRAGHVVKLVSVTNGQSGHYAVSGPELTAIRRAEAARSAAVIGALAEVWDFPDGRLEPTLELRERIIREIRGFQPDLVLTHRTCDYHPDHRAVGLAVQDASYLVTVPPICSDVPVLRRDPVVACMNDLFTRPCALAPDVVIDVTCELATIVAMCACHESQFFDWLPFNQ
ncbi:MAG: PIG-L family deacetylase, partial [Planctomycetaceae bacterium]